MREMVAHLLGAERLGVGRAVRVLEEDDPKLASVNWTETVADEPASMADLVPRQNLLSFAITRPAGKVVDLSAPRDLCAGTAASPTLVPGWFQLTPIQVTHEPQAKAPTLRISRLYVVMHRRTQAPGRTVNQDVAGSRPARGANLFTLSFAITSSDSFGEPSESPDGLPQVRVGESAAVDDERLSTRL
jgi:hypothetical protein